QLGGGLFSVNHRRAHFAPLVLFFLIRVADMGQSAVLEQESRDVRRAGRREDGLHDDQQRNGEKRTGGSPDPRPERQRNQNGERADSQPMSHDERRENVGFDQVKADERGRRQQ